MVSFRDLVSGLRQLDIDRQRPVIVHASLSSLGDVKGGADSVLGALLTCYPSILMPTFTYKTMIIPETGPNDNGLTYGSGEDQNRMAEFYTIDKPADRLMGVLAETLRKHPDALRSWHPILSFAGINVKRALEMQSLQEPLAPIRVIEDLQGWVILMGVNHTVNTSIHYAEKLAGRKQFVRWALTQDGAKECPGFPGCSDGFNQAEPELAEFTRKVSIGEAVVQALPLQKLVDKVIEMINHDPSALLCQRDHCERCDTVRASLAQASS
jgi:aminoglycoside 3-N-acetyltransferase